MYYIAAGMFIKIFRLIANFWRKSVDDGPVIVIHTARIGDMVCATPLIRELKKLNPERKLVLIASREAELAVKGNPRIDFLIPINEIKANFQKIKQTGNCYVLSPSAKNLYYANRLLPERIISIVPDFGRTTQMAVKFLADRKVGLRKSATVLETYLEMLKHDVYYSSKIVEPSIKKDFYDQECAFPGKDDSFKIAIAISAGNKIKEWGKEKIRSLIEKIKKDFPSTEFYLLGVEADRSDAGFIAQELLDTHNLCGKFNLQEAAFIIKNTDLFIGMDSALTHIADSYDKHVINIFGPTDFSELRAMNPNAVIVYHKTLDCRPCSSVYRTVRGCLKTPEKECLEKISVQEVYEIVSRIIQCDMEK